MELENTPIAQAEIRLTERQVWQFNRTLAHRGGGWLLMLVASVLLLAGAAALWLSPAPALRWLALLGPVLAAGLWLQPLLLRRSVKRLIREDPRLLRTHVLTLTDDGLQDLPLPDQPPPYTEIRCPYALLYEVLRTPDFYYFRTSVTVCCLLPRRLLTTEQEVRLETALAASCGERFVKLDR